MRLIDETAYQEKLAKTPMEVRTFREAVEIAEAMPTIDAVEVVRCKECKHWDKEPDEREGCCFGIADGGMLTDPDEFCSRGERRADDGK